MTELIPDYRLKIERAKRHINELAGEVTAFHAREPYVIRTEDDFESRQRSWIINFREPIPQTWSAIIGDAIHNMRASLDLLLCAVVRRCDPARNSIKHVHFVIRDTREEFVAALPQNIKGASAQVRTLLEELKPYKGGNEGLWFLHHLDRINKHQAIIPVWSKQRSIDYAPFLFKNFAKHAKTHLGLDLTLDDYPSFFVVLKGMGGALYDGAELVSASFDNQPFENKMQFIFEITFGEDSILGSHPVDPTLTQLCNLVAGVADIFERHILTK